MSDAQEAGQDTSPPAVEDRSFQDIVRSLVGQTVTIVNPESYEHAPVGYQLKPGFYRAKLAGIGRDYLAVLAEHKKAGRDAGKELVKQFVPFSRIKRVSLTKTDRFIHL